MQNTHRLVALLFGIFGIVAWPAHATLITVPNYNFSTGNGSGNFQDPFVAGTYNYPTVWSNWTATVAGAGGGFYLGNQNAQGAFVGNRTAELYYGSGNTGTILIDQTLSGTPVVGYTVYTLGVDLTGWGDRPAPNVLDIRLMVGGVELSGGILSAPALQNSQTSDNWVTWTKTYTTGGSVPVGNLQVELFSNSTTTFPLGKLVFFDNVTLDASPVPEPSTLLLFGIGGMLLFRRRSVRFARQG